MKKITLLLIALFTVGGLRAQGFDLFERPDPEDEVKPAPDPAPKAEPKFDFYIPANGIWYAEMKNGAKIGYYEDKAKKEFLVYKYGRFGSGGAVFEYEMIKIPLDKSKPVAPNFKVKTEGSKAYLEWEGKNSHINTKLLSTRFDIVEYDNDSDVIFSFEIEDLNKARELADKLNAAVINVK